MPLPPIGTKPPVRGGLQPKPPAGARPPATRIPPRGARQPFLRDKPTGAKPPSKILPPIDTKPLQLSKRKVDILEPPVRPTPPSTILPPISTKPAERKEEVYKGAFDASGVAPAPEDPSRYEREFEEDVEKYLVKFERACSNMSRALEEYQDTIDEARYKYSMTLHPNELAQMYMYMVDLCPAALEIMSSIADYGRGLASRYGKKYPDYWKNPKYEKLLIRGYTAQKEILSILRLSKQLKLPTSNAYSGYVINSYNKLEVQLVLIEGVKSYIPENGGNFYLSATESNINNVMAKISDLSIVLITNTRIYLADTDGQIRFSTPMTIPEVKYTKEEARKDLEKDGAITSPNQRIVEELEAIQRALKKVKWYNYRLEPHKRGKQYKIASDNLSYLPSEVSDEYLKHVERFHYSNVGQLLEKIAHNTNARIDTGIKIPLVDNDHFEGEYNLFHTNYQKRSLENYTGRYMIVGELRNFRMVRGDGKLSYDPTHINYATGHHIIIPQTFRGTTSMATTNYPCNFAIVAEVYVYPQYKNAIDVLGLFHCSYTAYRSINDESTYYLENVAIVDQGKLNVDVIYDVEDFFKANNQHKAEKEEYERDVAEALRDERAGNKSAKSDKILKDANRILNNLGYFRDATSKPKWSEKLELDLRYARTTPSGIVLGNFDKLNLATLIANIYTRQYYSIRKAVSEAYNHIEKIANRYYWYLPKPGEPGYIGDTKDSLEKKTKDLLSKIRHELNYLK